MCSIDILGGPSKGLKVCALMRFHRRDESGREMLQDSENNSEKLTQRAEPLPVLLTIAL